MWSTVSGLRAYNGWVALAHAAPIFGKATSGTSRLAKRLRDAGFEVKKKNKYPRGKGGPRKVDWARKRDITSVYIKFRV